jgi:WD40 repeat protein
VDRLQVRSKRWLHNGAARVAVALPDGLRFAAGTGRLGLESGEDSSGYIYIWDFHNPNSLRIVRAHSDEVLSLATSPSSLLLVSGPSDSTARVWDVDSGAERGVFRGHQGNVRLRNVTPDGRYVVSGSRDGTIQVWEPEGAWRVAGFSGEAAITDLEISLDGRFIVAGDGAGRVFILRLVRNLTSGQMTEMLPR